MTREPITAFVLRNGWIAVQSLTVVTVSLLLWSTITSAEANEGVDVPAELQVGVAEVDITPPVGMRLCGSFNERLSTGVHDPLMARAIVLSQAKQCMVIVGCDLAMISPSVASQARTKIASSCGIPPHHVLIHGSETHNGPDYFGEFRDALHRQAVAKHGHDSAEPVNFPKMLAQRIASAVSQAHENRRSASLSFVQGDCDGIAFYRRYRMKDGSIGWNPGKLNPNVVTPTGPTDTSVPILAIHREGKRKPSGIITGFAMHLAILDDSLYGADYPFYVRRGLQSRVAADLFVHFMQAPCCEVNHVDVSHKRPQTGHAWAEHVGENLADAVNEALRSLQPLDTPKLAARAKIIALNLRQYSPDEVARKQEIWFGGRRQGVEFLDLVHAATVSGIYDRHEGGPVPVLLQAFQLDADTAIIGLPSEVSVEFGLRIKKYSPFKNTCVLQLSNDWCGYIPPRRIFEEGNYEAAVAKIRPGEGERLTNEAIALLNELSAAP